MKGEEKPKLLIVDQDPQLLRALTEALEQDFLIQGAMEGEAALKSLQMASPQVMLLGPDLPGLNVMTLVAILKRRTDRPGLVLTALNDLGEIKALIASGDADGCVCRPYNIFELKNVLFSVCNGRGKAVIPAA